ncbi:hypothetical protein BCR37DRAFT_203935 [Protomyces lactucae-debilis]|uniref:General transcription factor 3C polypeptide 1 winged-helix domain-containing protein n=1 Tax=Protomyces lactucae-debilis TaxID=2754530 RepID=A0A1Y2FQ06_PROLT|nr:uncharacterized protein BCR37DRAFT_203935 [Protomyces lactucae-debilis]ORY86081.1 hypothetical protein BCR37DRAFT_203935 [Protomyces lactucae-debilis]
MDDCLDYVVQQVALDGITGASLPRLWTFVSDFFRQQGQGMCVDGALKRFLWVRLARRQGINVWLAQQDGIRRLENDTDVLDALDADGAMVPSAGFKRMRCHVKTSQLNYRSQNRSLFCCRIYRGLGRPACRDRSSAG